MAQRVLRSPIWSFFDKNSKDPNLALCKICKQKLSCRTTTSNLRKHLKSRHPTIAIENVLECSQQENVDKCHAEAEEPPPKLAKMSSASSKLQKFSFPSSSAPNLASCAASGDSIIDSLSLPSTSTSKTTSSEPPLPHSSKLTGQSQQQKISSYVPKKITLTQKSTIDQAFLKLFTADFQPFSIVEDEGFVTFSRALNPSYNLPSRKTISKTMIPAKYEESVNDVKLQISKATSVCLTTDGWTSINNDSFMALTAHFIDNDFNLQSVLLECEPFPVAHTSENLAEFLKKSIENWEITDRVIFIVSDNASNISKAIRLLSLMNTGCYAHNLNLVVKDGLESNDSVKAVLEKVRAIVVHFKRSPKSSAKLIKYQEQNNPPNDLPKKLILDVSTRWNSTFFMLTRFYKLKESVKATLALIDKDLPLLTQNEWKIIDDLMLCLKPFYSVTQSVSGEKYATGSLAVSLTTSLINVMDKLSTKEFTAEGKIVFQSLSEGVKDRLGLVETNQTLALTTFIDPRFKNLCYRSSLIAETTKQRVVNMVASRMRKEEESQKKTQTSHKEPSVFGETSEEADEFSVLTSLDQLLSKKVKKGTVTSRAIVEVDRYLEEDNLERSGDPLMYWKTEGVQFPFLREIAKKYLCCLCTSVPCERIFSKAGLVISERRNRLSSNKAKMLMFLNQNLGRSKRSSVIQLDKEISE